MSKRFQMPPLDAGDASSLQYALDQIEIFLNSQTSGAEGRLDELETAEDWSDASYENGWVTESGTSDAAFYKHNGVVRLRGVMNGEVATDTTAFTLPAGYRPETTVRFPLSYWNSTNYVPGLIAVLEDGRVSVEDNAGGVATDLEWAGLAHVSFRAD